MERVTSSNFQRHIGHYQDRSLVEPVLVTCNGRERHVLLSADEYHRLKRRDRQVMTLADFSEADLEAIRKAEPPAEAASFNHEVNG